jgi:hypothetical protein
MFDAHIFNTKVIHNEAELKGTPFVAPESRCGSSFIETFSNKMRSKEIVGKDARLRKAITTLLTFTF